MLLKTAKRSATVAWSPLNDNRGLLAVGTVANAIDDSFETTADLEILQVDFSSGSPKEMPTKGKVKCSERFHRLAWGGQGSGASSMGMVAGGMIDGSIGFWSAGILTGASEGEALVARVQKHKGPVRGLDFNQFKPNLLASGATESEILIWDLTNPQTPNVYTPGAPTQPVSDITSVAWNSKVEHILASTGVSGTSVVWDLRQKRPVISFTDSATKTSRSCLAWNPEIATQVMVASDDDTTPILQMWDLRNAHSPAKTLTGHTRGILAMSWCPFDPGMLLTCGKDDRTLCWNPMAPADAGSSIMCELPSSANWNFDVRWSPKLPAIVSTSSFDGQVSIYSLTDTSSGASGTGSSYVQAPGWLKRPAGAAFAFGGQLASFSKASNGKSAVRLRRTCTEPEFLAQAASLEQAVASSGLREFCQGKIADSGQTEEDSNEWQFLEILFEEDARRRLLDHIGFSAEAVAGEVLALQLKDLKLDEPTSSSSSGASPGKKKAPKVPDSAPKKEDRGKLPPPPVPEPAVEEDPDQPSVDSLFGGALADGADDDFLGGGSGLGGGGGGGGEETSAHLTAAASAEDVASVEHKQEAVVYEQPVVDEAVGACPVLDLAVKRAVIAGKFEAAVDCCFRFGRFADALLLAATGGRELFQKTQERYLELRAGEPFIKVTRCIVNGQLASLVADAEATAWKETLAILCTYATSEEFASLCDDLATRLKNAGDARSATLCYICAGNVDSTVRMWLDRADEASQASSSVETLQRLMEKMCVLLVLDVCKQEEMPPVVGDKFAAYAEALGSQGKLPLAMQYLLRCSGAAGQSVPATVLRERIFNSDARNPYSVPQDQHPPFPFQYHDVGVAPVKAKVVAPTSGGSGVAMQGGTTVQQREYNAVADAFGDAFGAPAPPAPAPIAQVIAQAAQAQAAPLAYQAQAQAGYQAQAQPGYQPQVQPGYQPPQQPQAQPYAQPAQGAYGQAQQAYGQAQQPYAAAPAPSYAAPAPGYAAPAPAYAATAAYAAQYAAQAPAQQQPAAHQATSGYAPQPGQMPPAAPQPIPQQAPPAAAAAAPAAPAVAAPSAHTVTQEEEYIIGAMTALQGNICGAMQAKMAQDVGKRVLGLTDKLKAGQVSKDVGAQLSAWCQAMNRGDIPSATAIQTALTATAWDDHGNWLTGTKRMLDQKKKTG
ncbi:hypothetical protein T484DRAFT_1977796 [Baffinella frigidus]|nr:hypothetical protein T484DRAFT_1977796 [Cryptophyta sp. CCMP2293]|mmetsp:Transcript_44414/g.105904  ORF Transcript_44414/g.105904 Transcript_44414/m.105904 type:complete len:1172 (-) Transcript_44414:333-3848(-)|eukprot:CAMPEP_0180141502 /NCGR_PEP_ID=MMETSP0986-20121125/14946_1 /TAXON_ID=697907 /ORGANISM="non described non described, Strain CCMP2293" /LENGTH=1171 /DNA_ID=CAMNT_0022084367 /DNA_START=187 /DNA_END=3702 /DNA_ORIENTATION=+